MTCRHNSGGRPVREFFYCSCSSRLSLFACGAICTPSKRRREAGRRCRMTPRHDATQAQRPTKAKDSCRRRAAGALLHRHVPSRRRLLRHVVSFFGHLMRRVLWADGGGGPTTTRRCGRTDTTPPLDASSPASPEYAHACADTSQAAARGRRLSRPVVVILCRHGGSRPWRPN